MLGRAPEDWERAEGQMRKARLEERLVAVAAGEVRACRKT